MFTATRWTLGRKIGLFTLASLVLGLTLFSVLAIQAVNESVQRTLNERLDVARIVADRLDQTLNFILTQMRNTVSGIVLPPDKDGFMTIVENLHNSFRQSEIGINTVYALDSNGVVINTMPVDINIAGLTMPVYPLLKNALEAGKPGVAGLVDKSVTELPVVLLSIPVLNSQGNVSWVLACSVNVEQSGIVTFARSLKIGGTGYLEIVDSDGIVLARTEPGKPLTSFEYSDHPTRFAELISSGQATVGKCHVCHNVEKGIPQRRDVLAFAPLSHVPLGVAIRQSEQEALLPARQLEIRLLVLGSILVLCTLVMVLMMMQSIVKPIRLLTSAANRLAKNDYEAAVPTGRHDEIGQLSSAFLAMRTELEKSRREMVSRYKEAKQKEEQRGHLLNSIIDAQEQERRRIARELHDEYGQTLTGLFMSIESVENTLPPNQTHLKERLASTKTVVSRAIDEMRRLILDLRPPSLEELGLVTAVKMFAQRQMESSNVNFRFETYGIEHRLQPTLEVTIFRILQEAIHNIAKHSHARNANVILSLQNDHVLTVIEDDGQGFNSDTLFADGIKTNSWGILGIRERTELMGGTFKIESKKGKGTRLEVEIPTDENLWDSIK